jgi:hypothetical protein
VIIAQDTEEADCMLRNLVDGYAKLLMYINFGKNKYLVLD